MKYRKFHLNIRKSGLLFVCFLSGWSNTRTDPNLCPLKWAADPCLLSHEDGCGWELTGCTHSHARAWEKGNQPINCSMSAGEPDAQGTGLSCSCVHGKKVEAISMMLVFWKGLGSK